MATTGNQPNLAAALAAHGGRCEVRFLNFDGNRVQAAHAFDGADWTAGSFVARCRAGAAQWTCTAAVTPGAAAGRFDVALRFRLEAGTVAAGGFAIDFTFDDWSADNYVLLPGAVYAGNRFERLLQDYPPLLRDPAYHRVEGPIITTDIPGLSLEPGVSRIEQMTGDTASPGMAYYAPRRGEAFLLLTGQGNRLGDYGLFVEESAERTAATFSLRTPCVRVQRQQWTRKVPSDDRGAAFAAGDEVAVHFAVHLFACDEVQGMFDRLWAHRRDVAGPTSRPNVMPFSAAARLIEDKYNDANWLERGGLYSTGIDHSQDNFLWQIGWVGGGLVTEGLLFGTTRSRQRALQNLDTVFCRSQAASGLFYGIGTGTRFWSDGFDVPHPANMVMTRKNADALYFFVKQFEILRRQGETVPGPWKTGLRRLADAFVKLWHDYGQFGQFADVETGAIVVGGSNSAAIASAGLVLAAAYFDVDAYAEVAAASARYHYDTFMRRGLNLGGPGEILQAPDSESTFGMLESLVVLYEHTGQADWLDRARAAAAQCASWCVAYDYRWPPDCLFGRLDIRTTGAVFANAQNKHAAPGICTLSGDSLLKLYRATGDERYVELLCDIAHSLPQYLSTPGRPVGPNPSGVINERCNLSDWEGRDRLGEVVAESSWPEVSLLLTWVEVPGLYVRPDLGRAWAIDNMTCAVTATDPFQLAVTNPTAEAARVKVWAETAAEMQRPLRLRALFDHQLLEVAPGQTRQLTFDAEGKMTVSEG